MHLIMIIGVVSLAYLLRLSWFPVAGSWIARWQQALLLFLLPPLLILMSGIAILFMGPQGEMIGLSTDWFSYLITICWLLLAVIVAVKLATEAGQFRREINNYPTQQLAGFSVRLLDNPLLFCAQIGFWQPQLVVSKGFIASLSPEHLEAVLTHEQAHLFYRDTFWFFWLGWLRKITFWLPNTEALWQEILTLREIRADSWAAQKVDPLILAEALLTVISSPLMVSKNFSAAFSTPVPKNRLQERIDALINNSELPSGFNFWICAGIIVSLFPLIVIPFHS
ncbi:MAG: M56 family metallopeptidase [Spirulinaceae cyanobacterium]